MTDSYLNDQNISNNIQINAQKKKLRPMNSNHKRDSIESYSSSAGDINETIDNRINDSCFSIDIKDLTNPNEDIEHFQKFKKINNNIPFKRKKPIIEKYKKDKTKIPSKEEKSLTLKHHLAKSESGNLFQFPRKAIIQFGNVKNNVEKIVFKSSISGEKANVKQTQSQNKTVFFQTDPFSVLPFNSQLNPKP